jgi:hypothetical protein
MIGTLKIFNSRPSLEKVELVVDIFYDKSKSPIRKEPSEMMRKSP